MVPRAKLGLMYVCVTILILHTYILPNNHSESFASVSKLTCKQLQVCRTLFEWLQGRVIRGTCKKLKSWARQEMLSRESEYAVLLSLHVLLTARNAVSSRACESASLSSRCHCQEEQAVWRRAVGLLMLTLLVLSHSFWLGRGEVGGELVQWRIMQLSAVGPLKQAVAAEMVLWAITPSYLCYKPYHSLTAGTEFCLWFQDLFSYQGSWLQHSTWCLYSLGFRSTVKIWEIWLLIIWFGDYRGNSLFKGLTFKRLVCLTALFCPVKLGLRKLCVYLHKYLPSAFLWFTHN